MSAPDRSLASKIADASSKVGALATDKVNVAQNYPYISADKILQRGGAALSEVGVIIFPSITSEAVKETTYTDNYGKTKTRHDATVNFAMLVSDGETNLNSTWVGRGSDYSVPEKALYKAITSGHKYFLAKLLNIGVGNEDGEHEPTQETAQTQPVQPVKSTNGKPAQPVQPPAPALTPDEVRKAAIAWAMTKKTGAYKAQNHAENTYDKLYKAHPDVSLADIKRMWAEVTEIHVLLGLLGEKPSETMYKLDLVALQALVKELKQRVHDVETDPFSDAPDVEAGAAVAEARAEA